MPCWSSHRTARWHHGQYGLINNRTSFVFIDVKLLGDESIAVFIARRATTQQRKGSIAGVPQLMLLARRNGDGVAGLYFVRLAVDAHSATAGGDEIDFLGLRVVVFLRAGTDGQSRLRQALMANGGVAVGEQFTNLRAVFGDESRRGVQAFNFHTRRRMLENSPGAGKRKLGWKKRRFRRLIALLTDFV